MDNHSKKIKFIFIIIIALIAIIITSGSLLINKNNYFSGKQIKKEVSYANYKWSFTRTYSKNNLVDSLKSFIPKFKNKTTSIITNKAQSVPALIYHGIVNKYDGDNITIENFKDQMFALKKAGWQTVDIDDFNAFIHGTKELPDKSFLITFDDGRKDSYYPVDPILKALNYHAIIYIITGHSLDTTIESSHYLDEKELKNMIKSGRWDIQSHSRNGHQDIPTNSLGNIGHFLGNKMWLTGENRLETNKEFSDRIKEDLTESKIDLERELHTKSLSFAFPYSDYIEENKTNFPQGKESLLNTVQSLYSIAFYQWGKGDGFSSNYVTSSNSKQFLFKRIIVKPDWSGNDTLENLERGHVKSLPYSDSFSQKNGWINTWGNFTIDNSSKMTISANNNSKGSSILLDGSNLWENYTYTTKIDWLSADSVSLFGHFKADTEIKSYIGCNFSKGTVVIENIINGLEVNKIGQVQDSNITSGNNKSMGIIFNKNYVGCTWNGKIIIEKNIPDSFSKNGGIGMEIWSPETGQAKIVVHGVSVNEDPLNTKIVSSSSTTNPVVKTSTTKTPITEKQPTDGFLDVLNNKDWQNVSDNFSILKVSNSWKNYYIKIKAYWLENKDITLISRYQDPKNYIGCSYSNFGSNVKLFKIFNGETTVLTESSNRPISSFSPWPLEMKVQDNHIECLINDQSILTADNNDISKTGAAGFIPNIDNLKDAFKIKQIVVTPF